jgi:hypothetical protein
MKSFLIENSPKELAQIQQDGPDWEKLVKQEMEQAASDFDAGAGEAGLMGGGSELGGGLGGPEGGEDMEGETPEGGGAETTPPEFGGQVPTAEPSPEE